MDGLKKNERNRRRKIEEYKWRPTRIEKNTWKIEEKQKI